MNQKPNPHELACRLRLEAQAELHEGREATRRAYQHQQRAIAELRRANELEQSQAA